MHTIVCSLLTIVLTASRSKCDRTLGIDAQIWRTPKITVDEDDKNDETAIAGVFFVQMRDEANRRRRKAYGCLAVASAMHAYAKKRHRTAWSKTGSYNVDHIHRTMGHSHRIYNRSFSSYNLSSANTEHDWTCDWLSGKYSNKNILRAGCITPQCGITFMAIDRRISARLMSFRLWLPA